MLQAIIRTNNTVGICIFVLSIPCMNDNLVDMVNEMFDNGMAKICGRSVFLIFYLEQKYKLL